MPVSPADVAKDYLDALSGFLSSPEEDLGGLMGLLTEDVEWKIEGHPNMPLSGHRHGKEEVAEYFHALREHFEPEVFEIETVFGRNGEAFVFGHFRHRITETDRQVESDWVMRMRVRDGRVAYYQIFEDTWAVARGFALTE